MKKKILIAVMVLTAITGCNSHNETILAETGKVSESVSTQILTSPNKVASGNQAISQTQRPSPANAGSATFAFKPYRRYQRMHEVTTVNFEAVAIADFTGDGRDDLATVPSQNQIEVFIQLPDGTLADPLIYTYGGEYRRPKELVVGDFNEDGVQDIAAATVNVDGSSMGIGVLLSDGHGGLAFKIPYYSDQDSTLRSWVVFDANDDGHLDIVAAQDLTDYSRGAECGTGQPTCPRYHVLYGDGKGSFAKGDVVMIGLPHRVFQLEAVDLNDDGRKDLVALLGGGFNHPLDDPGTTQVAYALPGGGLSKMVELHTGSGVAGGNIVFADLNADGISDSFMSKNDQHYYAELRIRSLQNTYVSPMYLWSYPLLPSLALAEDFDGDRRADIVMSQLRPAGGGYEIMVGYYRQVNGELQSPVFTTLSYQPSQHRKAYATGDLNSDGCKDLVIAAIYNGLFFLDGSQCAPYLPILPDETGYIRRVTIP